MKHIVSYLTNTGAMPIVHEYIYIFAHLFMASFNAQATIAWVKLVGASLIHRKCYMLLG